MATQLADCTVVIGAASRHGSTTDIAARIQHTMRENLSERWSVRRSDVSDLHAFEDADAVVLGSAIYLGRWLRPAVRTLHALKDDPLLDLWLFSTGPISNDASENTRVIAADEMVDLGHATEHVVFAGRLDPARLSWWERLITRVVGASPGDQRDWAAVDRWATSIAQHLTATSEISGPRS